MRVSFDKIASKMYLQKTEKMINCSCCIFRKYFQVNMLKIC